MTQTYPRTISVGETSMILAFDLAHRKTVKDDAMATDPMMVQAGLNPTPACMYVFSLP